MAIKLQAFLTRAPVKMLGFLLVFFISLAAAGQRSSRKTEKARRVIGMASWYNDSFHGKKTSSGQRLDQKTFTCAANGYKIGTRLKVTNLKSGKSVIVRVNDRMHAANKRVVDLTRAAALQIGLSKSGIIRVSVENLSFKPAH